MSKTPNPGSDEAGEMGCICPVLDNGHGNEKLGRSRRGFWIDERCPVHAGDKETLSNPTSSGNNTEPMSTNTTEEAGK